MVPEAIVIGAGPAGATAALTLARAGLRVRMIDRALFPRDKLCGDTLNPGSLAMLDRLGLGLRIRSQGVRTIGMTVTGPGRATVTADYPDHLYGVALRRCYLDLALVSAAVEHGVQFEPGVRVHEAVVSEDGARVIGVRLRSAGAEAVIHSRVVIAADGRASQVAGRLSLATFARAPRRWAFGAYFTGIHGLTGRGEMHIRVDGYIGIAPLPGGLANVCVVRRERAGQPHRADAIIAGAIAADAVLAERFAGAVRVSPVAALGPLAVESRAAGCPGLLLAGDAAGFVDPMTGDGMRFAIRGGELAALAAIRELATGIPSFRALAVERNREFAAKWRVNRALRSLAGSPRALQLAAALARRWSTPVAHLIGVAGDVSLARHA